MIKQVNRKQFNTKTATPLGKARGGRGEFRFNETLYVSPKGDFYLHGKGGTATRWNGGENVIELLPEVKNVWVARNLK